MPTTRYLRLAEIIWLHQRLIEQSGGAREVRDFGALEAAVAQPRATFDGKDLYPGLPAKASALCYALVLNHPFVDGNKRIGHAALESFLYLNGFELNSPVDVSEHTFLALAAGTMSRDELTEWITRYFQPL